MTKFRSSEIAAACLGAALVAGVAAPAFADDVPAAAASAAAPAAADDGKVFSLTGDLTVDGIAPLQGGANHKVTELDKAGVGVERRLRQARLAWRNGADDAAKHVRPDAQR